MSDQAVLSYLCGDPQCAEARTYQLSGTCRNCGKRALVAFSRGHEAWRNPDLENGPECPNCGLRRWVFAPGGDAE